MSFRFFTLPVFYLLLFIFVQPVSADVFKPAYLQLKQTADDSYEVMWKVPALVAGTALKVEPLFPQGTQIIGKPSKIILSGALVQRWQVLVPGGLEGKPVVFKNLQNTGIDVLVRVERMDGSEQIKRILPVEQSFTLKPSPGSWEVVQTYTILGIEHILMGVDHLLFVLALLMIVHGKRRLLVTVTTFTFAHSITLVLATLGVLNLPGPPVEAIIALSIVFVASEILHIRLGRVSLAAQKPWLVALTFGLLHGLGFAGALAEVGLPQNAIPLALLFFNVGVEIGQLVFIAAVLLVIYLSKSYLPDKLLQKTPVTVTYSIGAIASFWLIERIVAFW